MFNLSQTIARPVALLAALSFAPAVFATPPQAPPKNSASQYGENADGQVAGKTIVLKPTTKSVNVNSGDTVRFVKGDKTFTYHFGTVTGEDVFNMSKIAPPGFMVDNILVYVGSNPLYSE